MSEPKNKLDELIEHVENYADTQQALIKLTIVEKTSVGASLALSGIIIGSLLMLVFLFGSIALAFYLSSLFEKNYTGFLIVAAIYFVLAMLLILFRNSLLKTPITNAFIKNNL